MAKSHSKMLADSFTQRKMISIRLTKSICHAQHLDGNQKKKTDSVHRVLRDIW